MQHESAVAIAIYVLKKYTHFFRENSMAKCIFIQYVWKLRTYLIFLNI